MGTFKRGLVLGGIIGAGLAWLNLSKRGRELRDQLLDHAATVYEDIKKEVLSSDTWKTITKSKYYRLVEESVDKYAIKTGLADSVKDTLAKILRGQWRAIELEIKKRTKL